MAAILDIIMSTLFGGILVIIALTSNQIASENQSIASGDMLVQEILTSTAMLVEGEFRNMGVGVPGKTPMITLADSNHIIFLTHLDHRGLTAADVIEYSVGDPSELAGTQNKLDRHLKRGVNGAALVNLGVVTIFQLKYYGDNMAPINSPVDAADLPNIRVVEVTIEVQNPYAMTSDNAELRAGARDAQYSSSLWQQTRLTTQNQWR